MRLLVLSTLLILSLYGCQESTPEPAKESAIPEEAAQNQLDTADFSFINFVTANKERASISFLYNDIRMTSLNDGVRKATGSIAKLIVAAELFDQVAKKRFKLDQKVKWKDLDRFDIGDENYDSWKSEIGGSSPNLREVMKGMMLFDAHPNTDYLMSLLGMENLNERPAKMAMRRHQVLIPFVASYIFCHNSFGKDAKSHAQAIGLMNFADYREEVMQVHDKLLSDSSYRSSLNLLEDPVLDSLWASKFPLSAAADYSKMMQEIVLDSLPKSSSALIKSELETYYKNDYSPGRYSRVFFKSSDLGTQLNHIVYYVTNQNVRLEFCCMFNDLNPTEKKLLKQELKSLPFRLSELEEYRREFHNAFAKL